MQWAQLLGYIPTLPTHLVLEPFSVSGGNTNSREIPKLELNTTKTET